jgi:hypothetical protein
MSEGGKKLVVERIHEKRCSYKYTNDMKKLSLVMPE